MDRRLFFCVFLYTHSTIAKSTMSPSIKAIEKPWESNYKLPKDVLPLQYDLTLRPDLNNDSFTGSVVITVKVLAPTDFIQVHKKYLEIQETKLFFNNGNTTKEVPLGPPVDYEPNEFWIIRTNKVICTGIYNISMKFNGNLTNRIVGFYRSIYKNGAGESRKLYFYVQRT